MAGGHVEQDPEVQSHGDTHGQGSPRDYLIGFVLAAVLTAVPFFPA